MPLLNKLKYKKKKPWRDAKLFLVICEGERREYQYFNFFDGLSRQLKIISIPNHEGKSAPKHLQINAEKAVQDFDDGGDYELWIVMDVDAWKDKDLHDIQTFCNQKSNWAVAISNPCFEVWLYSHFEKQLLTSNRLNQCKTWKREVDQLGNSGFDSAYHPSLLATAIQNAKSNYNGKGYFPEVGSTQVYLLGEKIYPLVKDILNEHE